MQAKKQEKMKAFIEDQRARALAGKTDDNKLRQANSRADKKLDRLGYFRCAHALRSLRFAGQPSGLACGTGGARCVRGCVSPGGQSPAARSRTAAVECTVQFHTG